MLDKQLEAKDQPVAVSNGREVKDGAEGGDRKEKRSRDDKDRKRRHRSRSRSKDRGKDRDSKRSNKSRDGDRERDSDRRDHHRSGDRERDSGRERSRRHKSPSPLPQPYRGRWTLPFLPPLFIYYTSGYIPSLSHSVACSDSYPEHRQKEFSLFHWPG